MKRFRILYVKGDELRFTGNLDMHKVWERTFRRAGVNLAYSQGFHPQPKIQQACPLPLGFTSSHEVLDFWTISDPELSMTLEKITIALQPGISIRGLCETPLSSPPLQTLMKSATFQVNLLNPAVIIGLNQKILTFLARPNCLRERRGKSYDLRALVEELSEVEDGQSSFFAQLAARPGATGRPEELLDELGIPLEDTLIERTQLILNIQQP